MSGNAQELKDMDEAVIRVKNLSKDFDRFRAVDNISFEVKTTEIFGFLGPNGAGKTTTINILCTLLMPTSGEVKVNGFNVVTSPKEVRRFWEEWLGDINKPTEKDTPAVYQVLYPDNNSSLPYAYPDILQEQCSD